MKNTRVIIRIYKVLYEQGDVGFDDREISCDPGALVQEMVFDGMMQEAGKHIMMMNVDFLTNPDTYKVEIQVEDLADIEEMLTTKLEELAEIDESGDAVPEVIGKALGISPTKFHDFWHEALEKGWDYKWDPNTAPNNMPEGETLPLSLEDLHQRITDARETLLGYPCEERGVDKNILETPFTISNLDGDEDPDLLKQFHDAYYEACHSILGVDAVYHELWDCR